MNIILNPNPDQIQQPLILSYRIKTSKAFGGEKGLRYTYPNASYQLGVGERLLGTKVSSTTKKRCLIETKEGQFPQDNTYVVMSDPLHIAVGPFRGRLQRQTSIPCILYRASSCSICKTGYTAGPRHRCQDSGESCIALVQQSRSRPVSMQHPKDNEFPYHEASFVQLL